MKTFHPEEWRIETHAGTPMALGIADGTILSTPEFLRAFPWYEEGFAKGSREMLPGRARRAEYLIFLGTWCGDTHEQLPALIRLLDANSVDRKRIKLVSLTREKILPGWTDRFQIQKLPTFIVLEGSQELGRITETPVRTLAEDLREIFGTGSNL